MMRGLLLAPDWTESNVRSMVKAFRGGDLGTTYRALWGRVILKAGLATVIFNMLMASYDDDEFWERYQKAWKEGKMRWLDIDITPMARATGGDPESRYYFNLFGHFRDPVKFIANPIRSAKHKSSVLAGLAVEALEGSDWQGKTFTTWRELFGLDKPDEFYERNGPRDKETGKRTYRRGDPKGGKLKGKTVAWKFGGGPLELEQMPSFLANQAKGMSPVQVQNGLAFLAGELDGFLAVTKSLGFATAVSRPKMDKQ